MTPLLTGGLRIVPGHAPDRHGARLYPECMSLIRSVTHTVARGAGRMARELPGAVDKARREGERKVLERRHRDALAALGARALELSREHALTADALAPQIAEAEARLADVRAHERDTTPPPDAGHDAAVAFPMLTDDGPA